jgi:hypothetical protein
MSDNIARLFDMIANCVDPLTVDPDLIDAIIELEATVLMEVRR